MPGKGSKGPEPSQLPSAPTYYPTVKEFADPLAYIASIRPEAEAFGACKIVPPAGWVPPFSLDRTAFSFKTRVQSVHELQERSTAEEAFEEEYHSFLKAEGRVWRGPPLVSGREVDLYKLFRIVQRRGGYDAVSESKTWREICRILQVSHQHLPSLAAPFLFQRLLCWFLVVNRKQALHPTLCPRPSLGL